ncbi:MAG: hypothetical protein ACM35G_05670 [Planctomycetaceae bacterium]
MKDRFEVPVTAVLDRLEAGESPARVCETLCVGAGDLIAALAHDALEAHRPSLVQEAPRRPRLAGALCEGAWAELLPGATRPARLALAAGLLQIFDFWTASHEAAQQADDLGERAASAYWHAIAHRREPDPDNAAYWFRRVGRHEIFPKLADAARPLLDAYGDPALAAKLLKDGRWDPFAFIDLGTRTRPASPAADLAAQIQRQEMGLLLDATAALVLKA